MSTDIERGDVVAALASAFAKVHPVAPGAEHLLAEQFADGFKMVDGQLASKTPLSVEADLNGRMSAPFLQHLSRKPVQSEAARLVELYKRQQAAQASGTHFGLRARPRK
jgi:hypothetical protein